MEARAQGVTTLTTTLPAGADQHGWSSLLSEWTSLNGHPTPFPLKAKITPQSAVFVFATSPFRFFTASYFTPGAGQGAAPPPKTSSPLPPANTPTPTITTAPPASTPDSLPATSLEIGVGDPDATTATPSDRGPGEAGASNASSNPAAQGAAVSVASDGTPGRAAGANAPGQPSGTDHSFPSITLDPGKNGPPDPSSPNSPDSEGNISASASKHPNRVAIGVSIPLVIILLLLLAFFYRRHQKRERDRRAWEQTHADIADAVQRVDGPARLSALWGRIHRFGGWGERRRDYRDDDETTVAGGYVDEKAAVNRRLSANASTVSVVSYPAAESRASSPRSSLHGEQNSEGGHFRVH